jgi:nucleotide-binding universal stress UspA family protein
MKVLVTTDGSARSLRVLDHARRLHDASGATLCVVRVLDPLIDCSGVLATTLEAAVAQVRDRWTRELGDVLRSHGVEAEIRIAIHAHGEDTPECIERTAREISADLVTMDTRGAGALRHALFGSVAMHVVGHGHLPVMVTGPELREPRTSGLYTVLVTTDFSPASEATLPLLRTLRASGPVNVHVAHICFTDPADGGTKEDVEAAHADLAAWRSQLEDPELVTGLVVEVHPLVGAAAAIVAEAAAVTADAILMATHGHSAQRHLFAGSIALGVVGRSHVPVMLVPSLP